MHRPTAPAILPQSHGPRLAVSAARRLRFIPILALASWAAAAVPGTINYQGRLTTAAGEAQPGTPAMSLKIFDAATGGTQLYSEDLGNVTVDPNGVYAFQFGAAGNSDSLTAETLATTDGTTATYQKTLAHTPLPGTLAVADGTFSWNITTGNPGAPATATATIVAGFVVGATVDQAGNGYTDPPAVTITGSGTGATATATVADGQVTAIEITSAGSGYFDGATITIAPPPAPFTVNFANNTVTATYSPAPPAGRTLTATYRYSTPGIAPALAAGPEQWLELTVDGMAQTPRQKILAVPFAMKSHYAENASGTLEEQIRDLSRDLALLSGGIPSSTIFVYNFGSDTSGVVANGTTMIYRNGAYGPIIEQSTAGTNSVSQAIDDKKVRGVLCRYGWGGGMPGTLVYAYADGSISENSITIPGSDLYVPNPNPSKLVRSIQLTASQQYSWSLSMTVRINITGVLTLAIPTTASQRAQIGVFLNKNILNYGDFLSAELVGESGSQTISIDSYSPIQSVIGRPQKLILILSSADDNRDIYSTISGAVIRFEE